MWLCARGAAASKAAPEIGHCTPIQRTVIEACLLLAQKRTTHATLRMPLPTPAPSPPKSLRSALTRRARRLQKLSRHNL